MHGPNEDALDLWTSELSGVSSPPRARFPVWSARMLPWDQLVSIAAPAMHGPELAGVYFPRFSARRLRPLLLCCTSFARAFPTPVRRKCAVEILLKVQRTFSRRRAGAEENSHVRGGPCGENVISQKFFFVRTAVGSLARVEISAVAFAWNLLQRAGAWLGEGAGRTPSRISSSADSARVFPWKKKPSDHNNKSPPSNS
jgi:hypothetical protein